MKFLSIADDVKLGEGVKIFNFVNLYGCEIGDHTSWRQLASVPGAGS